MILKLKRTESGWYFIDSISDISIKRTIGESQYIIGEEEERTFKLLRLNNYIDPDMNKEFTREDMLNNNIKTFIENYKYSVAPDEEITEKDLIIGRSIEEELHLIYIKFNDIKKEPSYIITNASGYLLNDDGKTIQHIQKTYDLNKMI